MKHIQTYFEGNNGGDFIEFNKGKQHDDNVVRLTVGHCCVIYLDLDIPIEILTSILIDAIEDDRETVTLKNPDVLEWKKEFNDKLKSQMKIQRN